MDIRKECDKRGWLLLNDKPTLECDEEAYEKHCEENTRFLNEAEGLAADVHGLWVVKKHFIDPAHIGRQACYRFIEPFELREFFECADLKNGVDYAEGGDGSLVVVANGQGYKMDESWDYVTTVFECRLLNSEISEMICEMERNQIQEYREGLLSE